MEKLAFALISAARKLRPYFQSHLITVVTSSPLLAILHKPEPSGQLMKWVVELSQYDITYKPYTAIKTQALTYFIADFADNKNETLCTEGN